MMFESFKYYSNHDWQSEFISHQQLISSAPAYENKEELSRADRFILKQITGICHEISQINNRLMHMGNNIHQILEKERLRNQNISDLTNLLGDNLTLKNEVENLLVILKLVANEQNTK